MKNIEIISYTREPISFIGEVAGVCYNSNTASRDANYKRGMFNLEHNHGRTFEFPDVIMAIEGYSARVIRELYTHIIGTSRLQASTRYIDYSDKFDYYTPDSLKGNLVYKNTMDLIHSSYQALLDRGIPKEDAANILPLGHSTKMVLKINLRALLHLIDVRMRPDVYAEFRELVADIINTVGKLDYEWETLMKMAIDKLKEEEMNTVEKNK